MIPSSPEEQVRESIPSGLDERGGRKPTHPALILCSRFYYLEIAVTLFCAPFQSGPAGDRMGAGKPAEMG